VLRNVIKSVFLGWGGGGGGGGGGGIFKKFLKISKTKWIIAGKKKEKKEKKNLKAFVLSNAPHPIKLINAKH